MNKANYLLLRNDLSFSIQSSWIFRQIALDIVFLTSAAGLGWMAMKDGFTPVGCGLGVLSVIAFSTLYFRAFSAMHEAVHGALHPNRKWNDRFGVIYGVLCFLPFEHWKEIHLLHHQWAGNVDKDPVMKLVKDFNGPPTFLLRMVSAFWKSWFPLVAVLQENLFWTVCVVRYIRDQKSRSFSRFVSLALPLLVWGGVFAVCGLKSTAAILLPSFLVYLAMVEIVNFPHHLSLPQENGETKLALWDQYQIARSCIYPKWLARHVFLNFNYHAEHHLFPTLSWRYLDALSEKLRVELEGYNYCIGNAWILENRRKPIEEVVKPVPRNVPIEKVA